MRLAIIILGVFLSMGIHAQENLVPNGSFENYTGCPLTAGHWTSSEWQTPTTLTPDYCNVCSQTNNDYPVSIPVNYLGFQTPSHGMAYAGIIAFIKTLPEAREYLVIELLSEMITNWRYVVKFYVSPSDRAQYAVSTLGAALTTAAPEVITVATPNGMMNALPQVMLDERIPITDTAKWVLISDTILAQGGERYLTIGNFNLDGDSDTLRFNPNQPPINGSPTNFAYYYIDDVFMYAIDSVPSGIAETETFGLTVYPNPSSQFVQVHSHLSIHSLRLLDVRGREVLVKSNVAGHRHMLDLSGLPAGMYMLEAKDKESLRAMERILKTEGP